MTATGAQSLHGDSQAQSGPPGGWPTVAQAASIMGRSLRYVQVRLKDRRLAGRLVGGTWYVDPARDAALRLSAGDFAPGPALATAGDAGSLAALTEAQRARAFRRFKMIAALQAALEAKPANMSRMEFVHRWCETCNARLPEGSGPADRTSRAAMYRWMAAYYRDGIAALVDRRGGVREAAHFSADAKEFLLGLYLKEGHQSVPYIYAIARGHARQYDWDIPSLRTVQLWLQKRVDHKLLAAGQHPKKFRDRCVPFVKRDWTQVFAMEAWVADHRVLDILVPRLIWNKKTKREELKWYRPWLTMFMDCRSWMPVGWILDWDSPNGDRVMAAFLQAVERYGVPGHVILDNGKDFRRRDIAGGRSWKIEYERVNGRLRKIPKGEKMFDSKRAGPLFQSLGVEPHFALPYNARAKVIERFFGIMAEQFDKTWPTYWGNNTVNNP